MAASGSSGSTSTVIDRQVKRNACELFYVLHDNTLSLKEKLEQTTELLNGVNVDVNFPDGRYGQNTLLHGAVLYGYVDIVRLLLEKGADDGIKNASGDTPLHVAVSKGFVEVVKLLLEKGADVVIKSTAWKKHLIGLKLEALVNNGNEGRTLQGSGKEEDNTFIIDLKQLLEKGVGVNAKNAAGDTPLHLAVVRRTKKRNSVGASLVKLLIKHEADVNSQNVEGKTPLHLAVEQSAKSVVKALLDNYPDVNIRNAEGKTPFDLGMEIGNNEMVGMLESFRFGSKPRFGLDSSVGVDDISVSENEHIFTSPHESISSAKYQVTSQDEAHFVSDLSVVNQVDRGNNEHQFACASADDHEFTTSMAMDSVVHNSRQKNEKKFDDVVLSSLDSDLDTRKLLLCLEEQERALFSLSKYFISYLKLKTKYKEKSDEIDVFFLKDSDPRFCLDIDVDVKQRNAKSDTLLHVAARCGDLSLVRLLLDKGAKFNIKNADGETPLYGAVAGGFVEVVRLLVEAGADVDLKNAAGATPLHVAVTKRSVKVVRLLLQERPSVVDIPNATGDTPLHLAMSQSRTHRNRVSKSLAQMLLKYSADVNVKNSKGETALHFAVMQSAVSVVRLLLKSGTEVQVRNKLGKTPLELARERGNREVMDLLNYSVFRSEAKSNLESSTEWDSSFSTVSLSESENGDVLVWDSGVSSGYASESENEDSFENRSSSCHEETSFEWQSELSCLQKVDDGQNQGCCFVDESGDRDGVVSYEASEAKDSNHCVVAVEISDEEIISKLNSVRISSDRTLAQAQSDNEGINDSKATSHGDATHEVDSVVDTLVSSVPNCEPTSFDRLCLSHDIDAGVGDRNSLEGDEVFSFNAKMFTTSKGNSPTLQSVDDKNESISERKAYRPKPEQFKVSEVKTSNLGYLYQLRLIMLILLRAMINKYMFRLGTEVYGAGQFYDLVFEYQDKESGLERKLFLQAKHVRNSEKKIGLGDFLSSNKDAPFSLIKYFKSYLKLKEKLGPKTDNMDLVICTNINFSLDEDNKITEAGSTRQLSFTQVTEPYKEFFKDCKCYKLVTDEETLELFSSEYQTLNTKKEHKEEESNVSRDFKKFSNNLIFAVTQQGDEEKMKTELKTLASTKIKDVNLLYDSFYIKIYDWVTKKKGAYLTDKLGKDMIQKIVSNLVTESISGISRVYAEKLLTSHAAFNVGKIDGLLEMIDQHNMVHLISPKGTKLTAIQAAQVLTQSDNYEADDSFVFVRLNSILLDSTRELVTNAFKSPVNNDLLIIDCSFKTKRLSESGSNLTNVTVDLSRIVTENPKKKIVFIAPEDHPLPAMFYGCIRHNVTAVFRDLSLESQAKLLATSVTLQGESVELSQVIDKDDKDLLDLVPLEDLISYEGLVIGTEYPTSPGYDESFYIERYVTHMPKIEVKADIFQDISQKKFNDHVAKTESEFQELCTEHPEAKVHWIMEENSRYIWVKSEGELKALQQYIDRNNSQSCSENVFLETVKDQRVVIISDMAGMGKSTILSHLSMQIKNNHPGKLVFRVDLNSFSEVLRERKSTKCDKSSAMDFLCNALIKIKTPLEKELLKKEGKVVLLFDGFDEVSPDYDDMVIDFIQNLEEDTEAQIWITTRPFMRDKLENQLKQFSCSLLPFTEQNQIDFLIKYWQHVHGKKIDVKTLNSYASSLVTQLSSSINDNERELTGIPLQVRMLAECFMDEVCGSSAPVAMKQFQLVDLYDTFIKHKYIIFLREKFELAERRSVFEESLNMFLDSYKKIHQWYACCLVFSEEKTKQLFPCLCPHESPVSNVNRIGIVNVINGAPHFVHRTFAEYLCAVFVTDLIKEEQSKEIIDFVLSELLVKDAYLVCRTFLNALLVKLKPTGESLFGKRMEMLYVDKQDTVECIFYLTTEEGNQNILEYLCNLLQDQTPTLRKLLRCRFDKQSTMLHAAATGGHDKVIQTLLSCVCNIMDVDKDLVRMMVLALDWCGRTALHWAARYGHDNVIQTLLSWSRNNMDGDKDLVRKMLLAVDRNRATALHLAARGGHDNVIQTLLSWSHDIVDGDKDLVRKMLLEVDEGGGTALHWAARYGLDNVIQTLLSWTRDIVDKDVVRKMLLAGDRVRGTALHWAAIDGHDNVIQTLLSWSLDFMDGDGDVAREVLQTTDSQRNTALHLAAKRGHSDVMRALLQWPYDNLDIGGEKVTELLLATNACGSTALHLAVERGDSSATHLLLHWPCVNLRQGQEIVGKVLNITDNAGCTALHMTVHGKHLTVLQMLLRWPLDNLDRGQEIARELLLRTDANDRTALHVAAWKGFTGAVEVLLQWTFHNLDEGRWIARELLLATDKDWRTALHWAAWHGHDSSIQQFLHWPRVFLDQGKALGNKLLLSTDNSGKTALHIAAYFGYDSFIRKSLQFTRDAEDENSKVARELLLAKDNDGCTALHLAASFGHESAAEELLGWPLEYLTGGRAMSTALLRATDAEGETAFDSAVDAGYEDLAQRFLCPPGADGTDDGYAGGTAAVSATSDDNGARGPMATQVVTSQSDRRAAGAFKMDTDGSGNPARHMTSGEMMMALMRWYDNQRRFKKK